MPVNNIGIIVSSIEQIPVVHDMATAFCNRFDLDNRYISEVHLIIEEFILNIFDSVLNVERIPFYLECSEKAIRIIFDISGMGYRPVFSEFTGSELEADIDTQYLLGLSLLKKLCDNIKHVKEGNKDEVHFVKYISDGDFKDIYGFRIRYPVFRKDVLISEMSSADSTSYTLRLSDGDDFFTVGEKEYFIISLLDGKHDNIALANEFSRKYGDIPVESVNRFVNKLERKGFLEPEMDFAFGEEYKEEEVKISTLEKILSFQYSLPRVDSMVTALYRYLKWAYSVPAVVLIVLSLAVFSYEFTSNFGSFHIGGVLKDNSNKPSIIVLYYAIMLFTVVCHEFGHALTCKRYGGRVNKMGVMLYYFQISAFADTSDAWLFKEKYKRILSALNGPVVSLFLASTCAWVYYMFTPPAAAEASLVHSALWTAGSYSHVELSPVLAEILVMVIVANLWTSFFNLLPFVDTDGCYILADIADSHNLRKMSMGYVLNFFRPLFKKPPYPIHPPTLMSKLGYIVYGLLCWGYAAAAAVFLIYFIVFKYEVALGSVFGIFLIVSIILFSLKSIFLKKIEKKKEFLRRKIYSYS